VDHGPHRNGSTPRLTKSIDEALARLRAKAPQAAQQEREVEERRRNGLVWTLAAQLGRRYTPDRACLDRYEVYHPAQREVLNRVRGLMGQWPKRLEDGDGLVFYGTVGTGKDHLMAALLYHAAGAHGFSCAWINGLELYARFRDAIARAGKETEKAILARLVAPQILAIADPLPPSGGPTSWNLQQLYRLVDRRYSARRPTWVSLNVDSVEDADRMLTEPIFDRLRESAEIFPCFWPSYRERAGTRVVS
jgi:DNA replication protein DnaC